MFFDNFASIRLADQQRCSRRAFVRPRHAPEPIASSLGYFNKPNGSSTLLDRLLYADIKTYLVELLMKQDQMSMAASIESRVPFLDHKLVEFAATLPDEWKLSGFTTKRVLRESMKGLLPESILNRPKMGFPGAVRGLDARPLERGCARRAARSPLAASAASSIRRRSNACSATTPKDAPKAATASGAS